MRDTLNSCRGCWEISDCPLLARPGGSVFLPCGEECPICISVAGIVFFLAPSSFLYSQEQTGCTCFGLTVSPERLWIFVVSQMYYLWPPHWWTPTDRLTQAYKCFLSVHQRAFWNVPHKLIFRLWMREECMIFPAFSSAVFLTQAFGSNVPLVDLKSVQCQCWHLGVASMRSSFGMQRKPTSAVHLLFPSSESNFCSLVFEVISSMKQSLMLTKGDKVTVLLKLRVSFLQWTSTGQSPAMTLFHQLFRGQVREVGSRWLESSSIPLFLDTKTSSEVLLTAYQ